MANPPDQPVNSELILYQTEDGITRIDVRLEGETVWLTQKIMAELFQKDVRTINEHMQNIFAEKELDPESVIRNFRITAADGKSYETQHYNLDVIISVGYRVKSHRGTQFRIWATRRLREYTIKGFTLDDERLKQAGGGNYFDELLARIRDIRSSEKLFWRKVLDIYATSVDYDPGTEMSKRFFAAVRDKMHWAEHGHTAAEIIAARADASRPHMGLTSWSGAHPGTDDIEIAKHQSWTPTNRGFYFVHDPVADCVPCQLKVVVRLEVSPELRAHSEISCQAERGIGVNGATSDA